MSSITTDITGPSNLVTGVAWSSVQHHSRHHRPQSPGYRCCLVQCAASQPTSQVPVTWLQVLSGPVSSITADITGPSHLVTGVVWSSVQHHSRHHRSQSPGYRCCLVQCPASQPTPQVPVTRLQVLSGPVSSITADITDPSHLVTGVVWSSVQHHSRHHRSQSPGYRRCLVHCPASQPTSQVPVTWLQALSGPAQLTLQRTRSEHPDL